MKTIVTLIFVLFISIITREEEGELETTIEAATISIETATEADETKVVRLYRRENAKVTKALSFTTIRHRSKLA